MSLWKTIRKPPWRTIIAAAVLLLVLLGSYALWSPGRDVTDGRHDLGRNGIYLQHGWLGSDDWFKQHAKEDRIGYFRNPKNVDDLAAQLRRHHITDVFPHLCPTRTDGSIPAVDAAQTERFLNSFQGFRVMPWVGGARDVQAYPEEAAWRANFARSIGELMTAHPNFAGVHINIEPCPSGSADFLQTLDAVRQALPEGKVLSVAAYPPPTFWQRVPEVHWDEAYYREVARRADQVVVMMYDTALHREKLYRHLLVSWTREVLDWSGDAAVLLALPAYEDAGVDYHNPRVENLSNALRGIHGGLAKFDPLPANYQGVAIYSEWEMQEDEWRLLREHFLRE